MTEYVIILEEDGAVVGMTTAEEYEKNPQFWEPPYRYVGPVMFERFEAPCWCAAMIYQRRKYYEETYDMHFCMEDFKNGDELCPSFHSVRTARAAQEA